MMFLSSVKQNRYLAPPLNTGLFTLLLFFVENFFFFSIVFVAIQQNKQKVFDKTSMIYFLDVIGNT